jgi:uncharacterized repeat protein (TIGR02543 family)
MLNVLPSPPTATLYAGTVVTLTASPAAGYVFTGWSGALSGTKNPSTVTMDADKKVTASFAVRVMSVIELKIGSTTMYVDGKPASGGSPRSVALTGGWFSPCHRNFIKSSTPVSPFVERMGGYNGALTLCFHCPARLATRSTLSYLLSLCELSLQTVVLLYYIHETPG